MLNDSRRITLVSQPSRQTASCRDWNVSSHGSSRIVFVPSFTVLRYAIENAMSSLSQDVDRVIVDRAATAAEYLELLATLPAEFGGDVMLVRSDATAYLSSQGRGGDRVLYLLGIDDVEFYFETNDLVPVAQLRSA